MPETRVWRVEKINEEDSIQDFIELTAKGVAMRFPRAEILESLRQAIVELETA